MSERRRAEHVADTRAALVAAARRCFAEQGYAATGTERIVAEARVTRGALYHHFRDKADLFAAVVAQVAAEVAGQLVAAHPGPSGDPWSEVRDGIAAFLDVCTASGDFTRIVLVDGPVVLGAEAWEALVERHGRALLVEWLTAAAGAGEIDPVPARPLAQLLVAMLTQASLAIARAEDRAAERAEMGAVLDRLLSGLQTAG